MTKISPQVHAVCLGFFVALILWGCQILLLTDLSISDTIIKDQGDPETKEIFMDSRRILKNAYRQRLFWTRIIAAAVCLLAVAITYSIHTDTDSEKELQKIVSPYSPMP